MNDQERISPHNINAIPSRQAIRIRRLIGDPISNSPNLHHTNAFNIASRAAQSNSYT